MGVNIRIGQRLKTTKGEYATVKSFNEESMDIVFHGNVYTRQISSIGKTLFVVDEEIEDELNGISLKNNECPDWIWKEEEEQLGGTTY